MKFPTFDEDLEKKSEDKNWFRHEEKPLSLEELNEVMHKKLVVLKDKVDKLNRLRLEVFTLRNETHNLCDEFLSDYNKDKKIEKGDYSSHLIRKLHKNTLLDHLSDKGKIEVVVSILSKLNCGGAINLEGLQINTPLYEYAIQDSSNRDTIYKYGKVLEDLDTIELSNVQVDIDFGYSLIDQKLYSILEKGWSYKGLLNSKPNKGYSKSFYVVVFNILKSKDIKSQEVRLDLIYNYTQYKG